MGADLIERQRRALIQATELLWENVEQSVWWGFPGTLSETDKVKRKIRVQYDHYHPVLVALQTSFSGTIVELEQSDVQNVLQYGAARRIGSIYEAVNSFCSTVYPDREQPLQVDESRRLSDSLLLIYVHMMGVFDAFAIALHRMSGADMATAERNSDLLKASFRKQTGLASLENFFLINDRWFRRVKDVMRNRYVHRVPPYIPPSVFTPEDADTYAQLERSMWSAISSGDVSKVDEYRAQQSSLGKFFPYITFIDSNEHVPLLPTVLDDVFRFQVVCLTVFESIIPRLAFRTQR
ncbi:hypothetical protein [Rubellimicrobium aerolatum]|uniref:Cthe-2314-like HEPN domain-containing protein n=1 Tax=Rubellimicrobium aerolatum TaxID=490979 RepID=A0ABW0SE19_9RHOB|nr:hypothetical protein [Rubellimicrobium aerolatum]MBP1805770.1 hypothetical protein [Rubellimicrobium aerolatum]